MNGPMLLCCACGMVEVGLRSPLCGDCQDWLAPGAELPELQTLTIPTTGKPVEAPARFVGDFAIHRRVDDIEPPHCFGWTLTHRASGYAVLQEIGSYKIAAALAEEIASLADWNFTNPDAVKAWPADMLARVHDARKKARDA